MTDTPRRRGQTFSGAIHQAALDELAEVGYARFTRQRVAVRAGASKASLYRRWPSRMELALDAVHHTTPEHATPPDTGTLRSDLLAWLRTLATVLAGPIEALRGLGHLVLADPFRVRLRPRPSS